MSRAKTPPVAVAEGLDAERVERGRVLFEDATVACATCHSGPSFTDHLSHDVGTGATLQTPALRGLSSREFFMHGGCAKSLEDRFEGECGGAAHGQTEHLSGDELADLLAYLRSL